MVKLAGLVSPRAGRRHGSQRCQPPKSNMNPAGWTAMTRTRHSLDGDVTAQLLIVSPSSASDLHFAEENGARYPWKLNNHSVKRGEKASSGAFMVSQSNKNPN